MLRTHDAISDFRQIAFITLSIISYQHLFCQQKLCILHIHPVKMLQTIKKACIYQRFQAILNTKNMLFLLFFSLFFAICYNIVSTNNKINNTLYITPKLNVRNFAQLTLSIIVNFNKGRIYFLFSTETNGFLAYLKKQKMYDFTHIIRWISIFTFIRQSSKITTIYSNNYYIKLSLEKDD